MGCCGQQRQQVHRQAPIDRVVGAPSKSAAITIPDAYFQYLGDRGLTVIGPISGKQYRFGYPGAVMAVDPRDRRSLLAIDHLKQVG